MNTAVQVPDWPAPPQVRALFTTRLGGVSVAPYDSFNLGSHVGDDPRHVDENRRRLRELLPAEPLWLEQVHGTAVARGPAAGGVPCADAAVSRRPGEVCVVLTADCLPVLFCDAQGSTVAAAHAGWRGLAAGVLENTLAAMQVPPAQVLAWLGPAIGPQRFEVGEEVREVFVAGDPAASAAFAAGAASGKWLADLYALARLRLRRAGVASIHGGDACTAGESERFFSFRRDGRTGRQASLVWIERPR